MSRKLLSLDEYKALIGTELGASEWMLIDQERINRFADVTEDHQFIHVNPELAKQTPFGTTVAHGYLTLSLCAQFGYQALPGIAGVKMGVNYGFNKLRFIAPVKVNSRIRGRFKLLDVTQRPDNSVMSTTEVTVDIEGETKPALLGEWLTLVFL